MTDRRARIAWCLYDWANSGFPTVIVTFVFAAYFTGAVAASTTIGTAQWSLALSLSGVAIAVLSPVFGAISDRTGRQKPWLLTFSALCVVATAALWFTRPSPDYAIWALAWFALANIGFEIATVFYNAILPRIVPATHIGRLSGWGWGLGYAGGLCCLVLILVLFIETDTPWLGLDKTAAEHVRVVGPMVALWFALFAVPALVWLPRERATGASPARAVADGLRQLAATIRDVRAHANIARFLAARLIYTDGLNTLFAFGGIYAAGTFGMAVSEIIQFGIALNVAAGIGAAGFAWIDDWIGAKPTILIALAGLVVLGAPLLLVESTLWFWLLAVPLGLFMGPAQAASRSLMARLAPAELCTEMFGLFALSGKVTGFIGPAVLGWATLEFDSQRAGMATVLVFLAAGFVLLLPVRDAANAGSGASR